MKRLFTQNTSDSSIVPNRLEKGHKNPARQSNYVQSNVTYKKKCTWLWKLNIRRVYEEQKCFRHSHLRAGVPQTDRLCTLCAWNRPKQASVRGTNTHGWGIWCHAKHLKCCSKLLETAHSAITSGSEWRLHRNSEKHIKSKGPLFSGFKHLPALFWRKASRIKKFCFVKKNSSLL